VKIFADAYAGAYRTLYEAKPVTCSVSGTLFDAVPAPCAVILDVSLVVYQCFTVYSLADNTWSFFYFYFQYSALPQLHSTREVSGHSVPIITCMAAGAAAILRFFGPESIGGIGDIGARIDAEVARSTGLSSDEIGHKVHISVSVFLDRLIDLVSKDIYSYRRKTC
jgi:hypothetical protein